MKDIINYYYNLNIEEVIKLDNAYYFKLNNEVFYFVPLKRNEKELNDILNVSIELKKKNIFVHELIFNKYNKLVTTAYNQNYCLIKLYQDELEEYDLDSIIKFNKLLVLNNTKSNLYRLNWSKLWSDKVDYFEYQISELGKDKNIILNSFSYYIGLAENAICYVNNTLRKYKLTINDKICLAHKRVGYPNYKLNYFNPLSFIFDLEVRDIAEFIKSAFFQNKEALNYLKQALKLNNFTICSLSLLYARLIYPTYYFDLYEKIMNDSEEESKLLPIIDKVEEYEIFLKEAYLEISKYAPIERIEWLLKKEL